MKSDSFGQITQMLFAGLLSLLFASASASDIPMQFDELGKSFVAGVNTDSAEQRLSFVRSIYSGETIAQVGEAKLLDLFVRMCDDFGVLKFHHSERTGDYLHIYAQSVANSQWHDFQFELAPGPPPRLKRIIFIAEVTEPVYLPNSSIDHPYTLDWLGKYIDRLAGEYDFSGAILLAKGDSVFFERYVGYADQARTRLLGPETRLNLGSGNKMFTALAVMQLRDEGKLGLTDTLARYFPDFPNREFIVTATVGQLLSHTSGLGDFWDNNYEKVWNDITSLRQMLPFVYDDSIAFAPGTGFQYSNSGFVLAGLLVEAVSGENYYDYIREHICQPLGMTHTESYEMLSTDTTLAERLRRSDTGWIASPHGRRGSSAGGGFSTPRDILKFALGLKVGAILRPASLSEMTTPRNVEFDSSFPYGYGFALSLRRDRLESFGHGGQAPGVNFEFRHFPAADLTMALFCNQDNGAFDDLRRNVTKLITGDR